MCGIAGIVDHSNRVEPERVRRLADTIWHRGPDYTGTYIDQGVALVSTRLSIIDLSSSANMPIWNTDASACIVFNGEIYNFKDIRKDLESFGYFFSTESDTEVVLAAYDKYGFECFSRFNGMFAICIYDKARGQIVFARDRFGKKNIYYRHSFSELIFCSEIKGILAVDGSSKTIDDRALLEFVAFDHVEHTLFREIKSLQAGHYMVLDLETFALRENNYFTLTDLLDERMFQGFREATYEQVERHVEEALESAVRSRLISDAPLAVMCSGGVDSSIISIMARQFVPGVEAYMVDVQGEKTGFFNNFGSVSQVDLSERRYAESLCHRHGLKLNVFSLTKKDYLHEIVRNTYYNDLPPAHLGSSIGVYHVSKMARDNGIKVMLSGEGADEVFGGYATRCRHFLQRSLITRYLRLEKLVPKRFRNILNYKDLFPQNRLKGVSEHLFCLVASNSLGKITKFRELQSRYEQMGAVHSDLSAMLVLDLENWISSILLRNDRASMEASIETRVPFLDINLVRMAANIPLRHKVSPFQDKLILKNILAKRMGKGFAFRPKNGFAVPLHLLGINHQRLFENGFVEGYFGPEIFRMEEPKGYFFSKLILLEIWHLLFVQGKSVEDVHAIILE